MNADDGNDLLRLASEGGDDEWFAETGHCGGCGDPADLCCGGCASGLCRTCSNRIAQGWFGPVKL